MSNDTEIWAINTLEVVINHYKELENEIREVRQSLEEELRNRKMKAILNDT